MTSPTPDLQPNRTIPVLRHYKAGNGNQPLVMVTAYDAPTARFAFDAGVDLILVGIRLVPRCLVTTARCR